MNKMQKRMLIDSLDDARRGRREMVEAENYDELIYQGWEEALEAVISMHGMSEEEFREAAGIKNERKSKSNDRRGYKKKKRR